MAHIRRDGRSGIWYVGFRYEGSEFQRSCLRTGNRSPVVSKPQLRKQSMYSRRGDWLPPKGLIWAPGSSQAATRKHCEGPPNTCISIRAHYGLYQWSNTFLPNLAAEFTTRAKRIL